jgi:hypothetical protein
MELITIKDIKNRVWTINLNCIAAVLWKSENAVIYVNLLQGSVGYSKPGVGDLEPLKIILSPQEASNLSHQLILPTERATAFVKKDRGQS